jgi:DNA segregation ATPase FtsK/SpoIIIE-like protein
MMMDPQTSEIVVYWRAIVGTLHQRGLLRERPRQGGRVIPEADAYLFVDRAVFVLDMQRLGGISREAWLDEALWKQWRAALQGRRVFVSDGGGLAICVGRKPGARARRLPAMIKLAAEHLSRKPYCVTMGLTKRGQWIVLDLAGEHRAILVGGTSGSGKTNLMQSVILQLAAKHGPEEVRLAIVDTKEVDFGGDYGRLPHLFKPIARSLDEAARLVEAVEVERLRRQAVMARAGVADWRELDGELPLLLLMVDEAADFARTVTKDTIVQAARKGRGMGVSLLIGTQVPSAKVIDAQIKGNLNTRIALQCATYQESLAVLGRRGAEDLSRPGLALTFIKGQWERVQTLRVTQRMVQTLVERVSAPPQPVLGELAEAMVRYALEELGGAFIIGRMYERFRGQISKRRLTTLAQQWEARGWLTEPRHATDGRRVTKELVGFVSG